MSAPKPRWENHPGVFANRARAEVSAAKAKAVVPRTSWWTKHAAPSDREGFIAAANERNQTRDSKRFALTYRWNLS